MLHKTLLMVCVGIFSASASASASASSAIWASWLLTQIDAHPSLHALRYEANAAQQQLSAYQQPRYNPSLDTSVERQGDDINYRLGLSSQWDWHNIRSSQVKLGELQSQQSLLQLTVARADLLSKAIKSWIELSYASKLHALARSHTEQTIELLAVVEQQVSSGEASDMALAVAKSAIADAMVEENEWLAQTQNAKQDLTATIGEVNPQSQPSETLWQAETTLLSNQQIQQIPSIRVAHLNWLSALSTVDVQTVSNRPVPTVGIGVGQEEGESLVSLSLSVPLTIRNDYQQVNQAAHERALASEQRFREAVLSTQQAVVASHSQLTAFAKRYRTWQQIDNNDFDDQSQVLSLRFAAGDLSLSEFLSRQQQLRRGRRAALTLQYQYQQAYINYLHLSATLLDHVVALAEQE